MIGTLFVVIGTVVALLVGFGVRIFGLGAVESLALAVVLVGVGILIGTAPVVSLFRRDHAHG